MWLAGSLVPARLTGLGWINDMKLLFLLAVAASAAPIGQEAAVTISGIGTNITTFGTAVQMPGSIEFYSAVITSNPTNGGTVTFVSGSGETEGIPLAAGESISITAPERPNGIGRLNTSNLWVVATTNARVRITILR